VLKIGDRTNEYRKRVEDWGSCRERELEVNRREWGWKRGMGRGGEAGGEGTWSGGDVGGETEGVLAYPRGSPGFCTGPTYLPGTLLSE